MDLAEIRNLFIDYFTKHNHMYVESSSLIPHNDDTLLFTNSGMVQFKNVFLGLENRPYSKAVTVQKCLRAGGKHNDLDNVGYTPRHHTFFEMLGNFSFGDYFKEQAIYYAWDFLTNVLKLDKDKLVVTVYHTDEEAYTLWQKISGLPDHKIIRIASKDNFWEMGEFGPCGPCTEIFYDHGETVKGGLPGSSDEGDRYIEIWNIVFMQYEKLANGEIISLSKPCIDTGMGLERIASILQGTKDNYDIDLFTRLINKVSELVNVEVNQENKPYFKVIADHIRAVSFMIADGIVPSNEGRGYILRRIIRRAVRYAYLLGYKQPLLYKIFITLKDIMGYHYKDLVIRDDFILNTIKNEEIKFHETFENGLKILNEELKKLKAGSIFQGDVAFKLYETYGFPVDLTEDILETKGIKLDHEAFNKAQEHHKELAKDSWSGSGEKKDDPLWFDIIESLKPTEFLGYTLLTITSSVQAVVLKKGDKLEQVNKLTEDQEGYIILDKTPFYAEMGGQIGDRGFLVGSNGNEEFLVEVLDTQKKVGGIFIHKVFVKQGEISNKNIVTAQVNASLRQFIAIHHTGAHLLACALRKHLGHHITQQGSLITSNRMRFDISHPQALTLLDIETVEELVNSMILEQLDIVIEYMPLNVAISLGAVSLPGEKYPDVPRTVRIGEVENDLFSFELCGGTHVKNTSELGLFKIISEGSVASGIRRIEAVCSTRLLDFYKDKTNILSNVSDILGADEKGLVDKAISLSNEVKNLRKTNADLTVNYYAIKLKEKIQDIKNNKFIFEKLDVNHKEFRNIIMRLTQENYDGIIFLYNNSTNNKINFCVAFIGATKNIATKELQQQVLSILHGTGGGQVNMYQGGGELKEVIKVEAFLKELLS